MLAPIRRGCSAQTLAGRTSRAHAPARLIASGPSRRPLATDRVAAVPALGGRADLVEDPAAGRGQVRHLDDGAGMAFLVEINEAAARGVALLTHAVAVGQRPLVELIVVFRPARPVLQPLAPRG